MTATLRRKVRTLVATLLVSLGTALFSGAVSIVVDGVVKDAQLRWLYIAGFTILGLIMSGGGAWLLANIRSGVGLALAATDKDGDPDRYQDEQEAFAAFGNRVFVHQTSLQIQVETTRDLPLLRTRLKAALRTLGQVERQASTVGLLFQGRQHVGFHLGGWLNVAGGRVDLYTDVRDGEHDKTHIRAIRLGARISTPPRTLDLLLLLDDFTTRQRVTLDELAEKLTPDTCMALAVNINGPVDQASFLTPVRKSALKEGASAVVVAALPAETNFYLKPTTADYESTVTAIAAVANVMQASPGLLYLKTPAVIPVALGRLLYGSGWIPMRFRSGVYTRFE